MRLIENLTVERAVLVAAQAENLARMRTAVMRSTTCSAVRPYVDALHPGTLADAPVMTRNQLAEWGSRPDAPHRITTGDTRLVLRSSGSSGRVRTLLHDRAFNDRVEAIGARGLCWDRLSDNAFVLNALPPGDLYGGFGFADAILARRGAAVLPAGASIPAAHVGELIVDLGVEAVVGLPGYLEGLHLAAGEAVGKLHTIFYLGDRMSQRATDTISASGPAVRSFAYSTTETGPIGYQCAHLSGSDHHVHEDVVVAEVVDADGRRLPDGTRGALAVTVLTETGTALVRYLVGDEAVLLPAGCPCGSAARIVRVGARDAASANIEGHVVTREMFDDALGQLGVSAGSSYQVITASSGRGYSLRLAGPPLRGVSAAAAHAVLANHQTLREIVVSARFRGLVVEGDAEPYLSARGKFTFFVSEGDRHD